MAKNQNIITKNIVRFYDLIKDVYPIKKVFLYGSHAKGTADRHSDVDVGVVIDLPNHLQRVEITANLFHYAGQVDTNIEPRCIFWEEYKHHEKASILADIVRSGKTIIQAQ
jgi:predicted nucleotidyltransferase